MRTSHPHLSDFRNRFLKSSQGLFAHLQKLFEVDVVAKQVVPFLEADKEFTGELVDAVDHRFKPHFARPSFPVIRASVSLLDLFCH